MIESWTLQSHWLEIFGSNGSTPEQAAAVSIMSIIRIFVLWLCYGRNLEHNEFDERSNFISNWNRNQQLHLSRTQFVGVQKVIEWAQILFDLAWLEHSDVQSVWLLYSNIRLHALHDAF